MNANLKVLKKITDDLTLNGMVLDRQPEYISYKVEGGTCFGINLFKIGKVAVQRSFMSAGTRFKTHTHDEHEYLIVYEGQMEVRRGKEKIMLSEGDGTMLRPGQPHTVYALEDTWMVGVTVPAASGYPNEQ